MPPSPQHQSCFLNLVQPSLNLPLAAFRSITSRTKRTRVPADCELWQDDAAAAALEEWIGGMKHARMGNYWRKAAATRSTRDGRCGERTMCRNKPDLLLPGIREGKEIFFFLLLSSDWDMGEVRWGDENETLAAHSFAVTRGIWTWRIHASEPSSLYVLALQELGWRIAHQQDGLGAERSVES
jgi:hypothetical protein